MPTPVQGRGYIRPPDRPSLPERDLCSIDCPSGFKQTRRVSKGFSYFPACRQKLRHETLAFPFSQIGCRPPPKAAPDDDVTAVGVVSGQLLVFTEHLPCRSRWTASRNGAKPPRLRAIGVLLEIRPQSPAGMAVRDDGFLPSGSVSGSAMLEHKVMAAVPNRRGPAHPVTPGCCYVRHSARVCTSVCVRRRPRNHHCPNGRSLLMHTIISCCGSLRSTTSKLLKYESPFCQRGSQPNFFWRAGRTCCRH